MSKITSLPPEVLEQHTELTVEQLCEQARREGALLMANTVQHVLNNQLAVTRGYAELLAGDERLADDVRARAWQAAEGARLAAETIDRLAHLTRLEHDSELRGWDVLVVPNPPRPAPFLRVVA